MTRSKLRCRVAGAVGSYRLFDSRPAPTRRNGEATGVAMSPYHSCRCRRRRHHVQRDRDAVHVVSYVLVVCLLSFATECDSKKADVTTGKVSATASDSRVIERRATTYSSASATTASTSAASSETKEENEETVTPLTPARSPVATRDRRDATNYNEENARPSEKCRYPRLHEKLNEFTARLPEYPGDPGKCGEASVQIANLYDNVYQRECKGDQRSLEGLSAFLIAQFDLKGRCKLEDINLQDITFAAQLVCQCSAACRTAAPCSFRQQLGGVVIVGVLLLVALLPLLRKLFE